VNPLLSAREAQIVEFASQGMTDLRIASELGISAATVASYWARIRSKLGVTSRTHAVALHLQSNAAKTRRSSRGDESILATMRQVLDQNPDPFMILTESGTLTYANRAFVEAAHGGEKYSGEVPLRKVVSNEAACEHWQARVEETLRDQSYHTYPEAPGVPGLESQKVVCYPAGKAKDGRALVAAMFLLLL